MFSSPRSFGGNCGIFDPFDFVNTGGTLWDPETIGGVMSCHLPIEDSICVKYLNVFLFLPVVFLFCFMSL